MKKVASLLFGLLILSGCSLTSVIPEKNTETTKTDVVVVTNFEECLAAGAPVMESYPRQCKINGKTFTEEVQEQTQLSNPASQNCDEKGGTLEMRKDKQGGEYGVCIFEDNKQCEEWTLFNGKCPVGGVKVTGYDNDQQILCAITGGEVDIAENTCIKDGNVCDLETYANGVCDKVESNNVSLETVQLEKVGLQFSYPKDIVGYDEDGLKKMSMTANVVKISDLPEEGPMGSDQLTANKDKDALANGSFGESMPFSVDGSEKVTQLQNGIFAKQNATLSMFDVFTICQYTF